MQKVFCIFALAVAGLVFLLFLADLIFGWTGRPDLAPFKYADMTIDIVFAIGAGTIAIMSWFTYMKQH